MISISEYHQKLLEAVEQERVILENTGKNLTRAEERLKIHSKELKAKTTHFELLKTAIQLKQSSIEILNQLADSFESKSIRRSIENILKSIVDTLFIHKPFRVVLQKRNLHKQKEIHIYKVEDKDGQAHFIPLDSTTGGGRDLIDIVMRILILSKFPVEKRTLFSDEPMKNLSKGLQKELFRFIRMLCEEFNIQWILSSHEAEYIGGVELVYEFTHNGIHSTVERISSVIE